MPYCVDRLTCDKFDTKLCGTVKPHKDCLNTGMDNHQAASKAGSAEVPGYVWLAGWYATKLHAVSAEELDKETSSKRPVCGSGYVYEKVRTPWAMKKIKNGVAKCKHCERMLNT